MKRVLSLTAGVVLIALLAMVAPALSARPYLPEPVEFDMAGPREGDVGAARSSRLRALRVARPYVSPPLRAPRRFNLLGLRWTGTAEPDIAVRVRPVGGRWGRWTPVGAHPDGNPDAGTGERVTRGVSAPVWAGESDELQYRLSRRVPDLRIELVNTTGSSTPAERVRTAMRSAVSRVAVAALTPSTAWAQGGRPNIVPRAAWGGNMCTPRGRIGYGSVKAAFVHHTVTASAYSPQQARAAVLAICRFHRNSNGWGDIGYNFVVDRYGTIYEGRAGGVDRAVVGAQAQGWNTQSTGIANLGTFTAQPQSPQALASMARLIRWKLPLHGVPTAGTVGLVSAGGATTRYPRGQTRPFNRVSGHRDGNQTSCPGTRLFAQLPDLRRRVGGVAPAAPAPSGGEGGGGSSEDDGGGFTGAR